MRHPRTFAGLDMLTVLTIDMSRGLPAVDADALMTSADDVYASSDRPLRRHPPLDAAAADAGQAAAAREHRDPPLRHERRANTTTYKASGEVPGYVLNQWSMSEHKGVLRVASTQDPEWWEGAQRARARAT